MTIRWETLLLLMVILLSQQAWADKVLLKSGKSVDGQIIRQDDKAIVIDAGVGTPLTYYRDEIAEIVSAPFADPASLADKLENEAVELIDAGKRSEGLKKMLKAIELDPAPLRVMNYGSILFGDGVEEFKNGNGDKAVKILKACEKQLQTAIAAFNPQTDSAYVSQCYFLLGEMYANAFGNKKTAKEHYLKAVHFYDHPAAKAALEKMNGGS